MDKSSTKWWMLPRWSDEYSKGVDEYIQKAFANEAQGDEIRCPCKGCYRRNWLQRQIVKDHMIAKGFLRLPEEEEEAESADSDEVHDGANKFGDNMEELLHDTFRNGPNEEADNFYKLVEEGQEELYPGCKNFSKLSFLIRIFVYKGDHKLSNGAVTDLLKILKVMQPDAKIPDSYNEAKKVLKVLGLDYTKIDACINDCILYWEENAEATSCPTCKTSRWKSEEKDEETGKVSRIPAKVLRYFPIKKRLQRLFMCREIAQNMTWHEDGRPKDRFLRHPADGDAWKNFDLLYPSFAEDPRNVRLGLASDGFSPFNSMSIVHSTWPVILTTYNLPPWMSMKSEFLMLALIIPGPSSPGNDIDVYMQPLVKDLKELFVSGIETYDASSNQMFSMRAALMTTISDFPGFAMLSGGSTKGELACPSCHYETRSQYLKHSKKMCYMHHRRFLRRDHPYRTNKRCFNGKTDYEIAPVCLTGGETLELLADFRNVFGKNRPKEVKKKKKKGKKKKKIICPWKKKSIFFDLPYWKHIEIRHCLDVMHIEKNICDNVIGTLLDISGKTKDHVKARMDLVELNMMDELQPKLSDDGERIEIAKSRFWMTLDEKRRFCSVIKNARLPQVCDCNIAKCVQVQKRKIIGYKSHDAHFLMQYLLPVAAKTCLPEDVAMPLIRLSAFFKAICSKVIDPHDLEYLQSEISEILCQFQMIFPPSFFDIMVHLPIHLVEEIRLGGAVFERWMYPIERDLRKLKAYVRNKSRPEGSMAESYLADECIAFCGRYLRRGSTRIDEHIENAMFPKMGQPIMGKGRRKGKKHDRYKIDGIKWAKAHRYFLFNCHKEDIERYISEHETLAKSKKKRKWDTAQIHCKDFIEWFKERVEFELTEGLDIPDWISWLSVGPSFFVKKYSGYFINGYKFHTMKRDRNGVTENSGVTLNALTPSYASTKDQHPVIGDVAYYGSIEEIIEIFYEEHFSVILFGCVWFQSEEDTSGLPRVNRKKLIYQHEPFILASQANQIFYVEDPLLDDWCYVVKDLPRDYSDAKDGGGDGFADIYWKDWSHLKRFDGCDDEVDISLTRVDVNATIVDLSGNILND